MCCFYDLSFKNFRWQLLQKSEATMLCWPSTALPCLVTSPRWTRSAITSPPSATPPDRTPSTCWGTPPLGTFPGPGCCLGSPSWEAGTGVQIRSDKLVSWLFCFQNEVCWFSSRKTIKVGSSSPGLLNCIYFFTITHILTWRSFFSNWWISCGKCEELWGLYIFTYSNYFYFNDIKFAPEWHSDWQTSRVHLQ